MIASGVLFGLFALLMGFGLIAERQGKADLARADGLWHEGKQAEAVSIYMSEMLYVDDARKPEVFSRIITQLYESGNTEGATDYYNKALDDDLHIEFANDDLQRYFDEMRKAMDAPITTEVTVEAQSTAPSDGAGTSHPKLEQAPLVQGMTYAEVCAAIGWEGTERGSLGGPNGSKTTAYKWDDEEGSIVASFQDDALDKWDYNKREIQTVADENQQTQALVQARLSDYSTTLDAAGVSIVRNINVKLDGDMWTVTLKVDDVWHYRPYQVRLQDTQTFWQVWAQIASPNDPDKARISIRDLNGNEVGGSRVLAGSLIWVQD